LGSEASNDELHRLRVLTKRSRYAFEAIEPVAGSKDRSRVHTALAALSQTQSVLGDFQDTVVTERWLRATASAQPVVALVAGQLVAADLGDRIRYRKHLTKALLGTVPVLQAAIG
jgi:CHAD domain-containing protein